MEDSMAGAIGCRTGALGHLLAEADGLSAEGTLIDRAILGATERNAEMFQLQHGGYRFAAHLFDRILVAEPIRALDRVVHVEAPIVAVAHIAERGRHAALRGDCMAARRKYFCDASGPQSRYGHAERSAHPGAAGADNHHVVAMLDDLVGFGHALFPAIGPDDIGIWINSKARALGHRDPAALRIQHVAVNRCL